MEHGRARAQDAVAAWCQRSPNARRTGSKCFSDQMAGPIHGGRLGVICRSSSAHSVDFAKSAAVIRLAASGRSLRILLPGQSALITKARSDWYQIGVTYNRGSRWPRAIWLSDCQGQRSLVQHSSETMGPRFGHRDAHPTIIRLRDDD